MIHPMTQKFIESRRSSSRDNSKAALVAAEYTRLLPNRELLIPRDELGELVRRAVVVWRVRADEHDKFNVQTKEVAAISGRVRKALNRAHRDLLRLGLDEKILELVEMCGKLNVEISYEFVRSGELVKKLYDDVKLKNVPVPGFYPVTDFFLVVLDALASLNSFDKHRPPNSRGRPKAHGADLVSMLKEVLCDRGGCTQPEFERFLDAISGKNGLPTKLVTSTVKKRSYRSRKRMDK